MEDCSIHAGQQHGNKNSGYAWQAEGHGGRWEQTLTRISQNTMHTHKPPPLPPTPTQQAHQPACLRRALVLWVERGVASESVSLFVQNGRATRVSGSQFNNFLPA
eukprot:350940-Chlamydomonas_euryale.AAC.1